MNSARVMMTLDVANDSFGNEVDSIAQCPKKPF